MYVTELIKSMNSDGIKITSNDGARMMLDERAIESIVNINVVLTDENEPESVKIKSWKVSEYTENKLSIKVVFE